MKIIKKIVHFSLRGLLVVFVFAFSYINSYAIAYNLSKPTGRPVDLDHIAGYMLDGYKAVYKDTIRIVDLSYDKGAYGQGYKVVNTSNKSYFIPTRTKAEWEAFKNHLPSGVSLESIKKKKVEVLPECAKSSWQYYSGRTDRPERVYFDHVLKLIRDKYKTYANTVQWQVDYAAGMCNWPQIVFSCHIYNSDKYELCTDVVAATCSTKRCTKINRYE